MYAIKIRREVLEICDADHFSAVFSGIGCFSAFFLWEGKELPAARVYLIL